MGERANNFSGFVADLSGTELKKDIQQAPATSTKETTVGNADDVKKPTEPTPQKTPVPEKPESDDDEDVLMPDGTRKKKRRKAILALGKKKPVQLDRSKIRTRDSSPSQ